MSVSAKIRCFPVDLLPIFILYLVLSSVDGRIHRLKLEDDDRRQFTLSTFGFLKGGTLTVNVTKFSYMKDSSHKLDESSFGFTLDKSGSTGMSTYLESMQEKCILSKKDSDDTDSVSLIFFRMNFKDEVLHVDRKGKDLSRLMISTLDKKTFISQHKLFRRDSDDQVKKYVTSDSFLLSRSQRAAVTHKTNNSLPLNNSLVNTAVKELLKHVSNSTSANNTLSSASKEHKVSTAGPTDGTVQDVIKLKKVNGYYTAYFLVSVKKDNEEGLYNLFFHNCINYKGANSAVNLSLILIEDNNGNYLSAGDMPLPMLNFVCSFAFFLTGCAWLFVLQRSSEDVYKMHYLMLGVVYVKSISCLFHAINFHFIQTKGIHEEAWAILYYIVYLMRGALLFTTILLIGAGWAFIKHMLSDKEKKLFIIIIPLQVLANVAWIIVEESEEGQSQYTVWKEIFILVDLLCCGAILFPVVWSIRHLQDASQTDGKAVISLNKLKLFRQFYILIVCYIYFTRIIVYLLKITVPFKYEWLDPMFKEMATFVFFIVTGYKFRPASDNPYLQVPQDSDEEIEMEEVLTKNSALDNVVKVSRSSKTQETEPNTGAKQRESSHEYD
ncbi:protein GPR107 [Octopus sinensis]|uniref:Protein GPR107 n=1 Tax=Octopus sinensis TaxID=2607531 RepID=A0A6P7SWX8_9MOLL|nr:protein GPR107 [Octopus sinensis]